MNPTTQALTPPQTNEPSPDDASKTFTPLEPKPKLPRRALITGAASGIGRAFAKECAKKQIPLLLVDINEQALSQTANDIKQNYNIEIHTLTLDLSKPDAPQKCFDFCDQNDLQIDLLANIAGIFMFDPLLDADPARTNLMIDLHAKTVTNMSCLFGQRMRQRRYGFIMNMASMSAWMPMPGIATYNATKSYIRSMSRSLRFELKPWNVSVTTVCPGGCDTPLLPLPDNIRTLAVNLGCLMSPQKLACKALNATLKRKKQTIPGIINHLIRAFIVIIPDWLISFIQKCLPIYERFYPKD